MRACSSTIWTGRAWGHWQSGMCSNPATCSRRGGSALQVRGPYGLPLGSTEAGRATAPVTPSVLRQSGAPLVVACSQVERQEDREDKFNARLLGVQEELGKRVAHIKELKAEVLVWGYEEAETCSKSLGVHVCGGGGGRGGGRTAGNYMYDCGHVCGMAPLCGGGGACLHEGVLPCSCQVPSLGRVHHQTIQITSNHFTLAALAAGRGQRPAP